MASHRIRSGTIPGRHNALLRCSVAGALRTVGTVLLETVAASFAKADRGNLGGGALRPPNVQGDAFVFTSVFGFLFGDSLETFLQRTEIGFLRFVSRRVVVTRFRYALDRRGAAQGQREYRFEPTAGGRISRLVVSLHTAGGVRSGGVENQCFHWPLFHQRTARHRGCILVLLMAPLPHGSACLAGGSPDSGNLGSNASVEGGALPGRPDGTTSQTQALPGYASSFACRGETIPRIHVQHFARGSCAVFRASRCL